MTRSDTTLTGGGAPERTDPTASPPLERLAHQLHGKIPQDRQSGPQPPAATADPDLLWRRFRSCLPARYETRRWIHLWRPVAGERPAGLGKDPGAAGRRRTCGRKFWRRLPDSDGHLCSSYYRFIASLARRRRHAWRRAHDGPRVHDGGAAYRFFCRATRKAAMTTRPRFRSQFRCASHRLKELSRRLCSLT
jgi:hypothetical protein